MQLRVQLGHSSSHITDHYSHLDANSTRFIEESIEKRIGHIPANKHYWKFSYEKTRSLQKIKGVKSPINKGNLIEDLQTMIDQARWSIASTVNSSLTLLYWHVDDRIRREILLNERAE